MIRLLGGLLSGYQLTGDERLLKLAEDLGTRMLPAFDSPTGLPYVRQPAHRQGAGQRQQSGRNRHAAARIRHAQQTHRQSGVLRQGQARAGRNLQAPRKSTLVGDVDHVDRPMDAYRQPHRRAHRLVLRVLVQVLEAVRRRGMPGDVATAWRPPIAITPRKSTAPSGTARWTCNRKAHGHEYGALDAFYPGLLAIAATSIARASVAGFVVRDVEPARHRAGGYRLSQAQGHLGRLSAAPGNRRVGLVPVPPHGRPAVPRDGQEVVRGLRPPLPHEAGYAAFEE